MAQLGLLVVPPAAPGFVKVAAVPGAPVVLVTGEDIWFWIWPVWRCAGFAQFELAVPDGCVVQAEEPAVPGWFAIVGPV